MVLCNMVRLIFLGTGGWITVPYRKYQCIFIEGSDGVIVLDCGSFDGTQYETYKSFLTKIKGIIITHIHGDHILGLPSLLFYMKYSNVRGEVNLITPEVYLNFLEQLIEKLITDAPYTIKYIGVSNGSEVNIGEYIISTFEVNHSIYNVGCKVYVDDRIVGYSSDTRYCNGLEKIALDTDLLICEASFPSKMRDKAFSIGHLTPIDALRVAKTSNVKQLILTHIGFEIENESKSLDGNVIWASDNLIIDI